MRRPLLVLIAGLVCGVVAVSPAAGVLEQTPKRGGTVVLAVGRERAVCESRRRNLCGTLVFPEKVLDPAFAFRPTRRLGRSS